MSKQPIGKFALSCAHCGLPLGVIEGHTDETGRAVCPRCHWWITYEWEREGKRVVVVFVDWQGLT